MPYTADTPGYNTDYNNFAPNLGVAWRPNVQSGWMRKVLGDPEQATVRAGYSVTFDRPSMGDFTGLYGNNPGRNYNANRNNSSGTNHLLVSPGESWPVLFRDQSRLGPPSGIPDGPAYPIAATTGTELALFDPVLEVPYTHSFSVGLQRALTRDMAFEVRYVGTRGTKAWVDENWNELNVIENGFFEEFKLAQQNLRSHVNGRVRHHRQSRLFVRLSRRQHGTQPLPILLAYLTGQPFSNAGNQALYTASTFTNTTLVGRLGHFQPKSVGMAGRSGNHRAPGQCGGGRSALELPPDESGGRHERREHHPQRRRVAVRLARAGGAPPVVARPVVHDELHTLVAVGQFQDSLHFERQFVTSTNSVPHALKITANWDLPVGRGKRYGTDFNPWMEGIFGNWTFNLIGRVQAGRVLTVTGARLVGMSVERAAGHVQDSHPG